MRKDDMPDGYCPNCVKRGLNKRKGNNNWIYQMVPYEDWQHIQSITTKDYTKGIFKETG